MANWTKGAVVGALRLVGLAGARVSRLSCAYIVMPRPSWRKLFRHLVRWARSLELARAGKSMAARMAMTAMTTNSSISVNPGGRQSGTPRDMDLVLIYL